MYIMPTLTAVHWFNSKPSFNYQSSDAKNLTFGQKVVSKGNIQKIKQIIFVASDTKPSDPPPLGVQLCGKKN